MTSKLLKDASWVYKALRDSYPHFCDDIKLQNGTEEFFKLSNETQHS